MLDRFYTWAWLRGLVGNKGVETASQVYSQPYVNGRVAAL